MKIQDLRALIDRQLETLELAEGESVSVIWDPQDVTKLSDGSYYRLGDTYELVAANDGYEGLEDLKEVLTSDIGKVAFFLPDPKNPDRKHKYWLANDIWFLGSGTWVTGGGIN